MMELMKQRFQDSDLSESYTSVKRNKFHILTNEVSAKESHDFDIPNTQMNATHFSNCQKFIESVITEQGVESTDKFIFGCQADNESLPFKDGSFDCYMANLSLMWVTNHRNQLAEAFRVTKSGARIAFSVMGREENDNNQNILKEVYQLNGLPSIEDSIKWIHRLGEFPKKMRVELEEFGFTDIRIWYQPMHFSIEKFEDYQEMRMNHPSTRQVLDKLSEEQVQKVMDDTKRLYEERLILSFYHSTSNLKSLCEFILRFE